MSINKYKKKKISKKSKSLWILIYNKLIYIKVLYSDKVVLVKKKNKYNLIKKNELNKINL